MQIIVLQGKICLIYILSKNGVIINMRMRKKRYGNERLTVLSSLMYISEEEIWSDLPKIYENELPLRVEIGCGKGGFITGLSVAEP